jgi:hypothetical protein
MSDPTLVHEELKAILDRLERSRNQLGQLMIERGPEPTSGDPTIATPPPSSERTASEEI